MDELEATRAKLKCLEMVEGTELHWWDVVKVRIRHENRIDIFIPLFPFDFTYNEIATYEFALGVVEGKPVWEGDKLFHDRYGMVAARANGTKGYLKIENTEISHKGAEYLASSFSWNPPKPATLMVELPIEDVKYYAMERPLSIDMIDAMIERRANSCLKALRNMK